VSLSKWKISEKGQFPRIGCALSMMSFPSDVYHASNNLVEPKAQKISPHPNLLSNKILRIFAFQKIIEYEEFKSFALLW
jgi:hypothetical protein